MRRKSAFHSAGLFATVIMKGQLWVKPGKAQNEQRFSGLPPIATEIDRHLHSRCARPGTLRSLLAVARRSG
jgi:hypothetical protein